MYDYSKNVDIRYGMVNSVQPQEEIRMRLGREVSTILTGLRDRVTS